MRAPAAPLLPQAWVDAALADLVAVDVERWRRFEGTITRTDRHADAHWRLELSHGPGIIASWWRGGMHDTVPELVGSLVLTHDGTSDVEPQRFQATVALTRTRAGWIEAVVWVSGRRLTEPRTRGVLRAPAPPREGVIGMDLGALHEPPRRWDGFPGPVTHVRDTASLDEIVGQRTLLQGLGDVNLNPDELLLGVSADDDAAEPHLLLRITAAAPLEDHAPEYLAGPEGERIYNGSAHEGADFAIERCELDGERLTLGGPDWLVQLQAPGLTVLVERLG